MRVKKPWVRARLTLEGWYVRFMINPTGPTGLVTGLSAVKLHLAIRMNLTAVQHNRSGKPQGPPTHSATTWQMNSLRNQQNKAAQAASSRYESGKPVIITDFSLLATRQTLGLAQKARLRLLQALFRAVKK